jgi:hypothetical protein
LEEDFEFEGFHFADEWLTYTYKMYIFIDYRN